MSGTGHVQQSDEQRPLTTAASGAVRYGASGSRDPLPRIGSRTPSNVSRHSLAVMTDPARGPAPAPAPRPAQRHLRRDYTQPGSPRKKWALFLGSVIFVVPAVVLPWPGLIPPQGTGGLLALYGLSAAAFVEFHLAHRAAQFRASYAHLAAWAGLAMHAVFATFRLVLFVQPTTMNTHMQCVWVVGIWQVAVFVGMFSVRCTGIGLLGEDADRHMSVLASQFRRWQTYRSCWSGDELSQGPDGGDLEAGAPETPEPRTTIPTETGPHRMSPSGIVQDVLAIRYVLFLSVPFTAC
ncbi:hypothetical protein JCM3770_006471 [Rhodotorula araucariae]